MHPLTVPNTLLFYIDSQGFVDVFLIPNFPLGVPISRFSKCSCFSAEPKTWVGPVCKCLSTQDVPQMTRGDPRCSEEDDAASCAPALIRRELCFPHPLTCKMETARGCRMRSLFDHSPPARGRGTTERPRWDSICLPSFRRI